LGADQIAWLEQDVKGLSASTPIVILAHMPLWTIYADWGWGTGDAAEALSHVKRFGSVTVLNGHIHQIVQKVEGNMTFQTARSTAYPQPEAGKAKAPGPLAVPADQLKHMLGLRSLTYAEGAHPLAIADPQLPSCRRSSGRRRPPFPPHPETDMFAIQFNRGQPQRAPYAPHVGRPLLAAAAFVALLSAGVSLPASADEKTI